MPGYNFKTYCIFLSEALFTLTNTVDLDEMPHNAAFHLDLHCKITHLGVSCIQLVKGNLLSHPYHLNKSISNFRVVEWYFSFLFKFKKNILLANYGDPHQMLQFAASDLYLHCLPMSHKQDAMLIQVCIRTIHTVFSMMHINEAILYLS